MLLHRPGKKTEIFDCWDEVLIEYLLSGLIDQNLLKLPDFVHLLLMPDDLTC